MITQDILNSLEYIGGSSLRSYVIELVGEKASRRKIRAYVLANYSHNSFDKLGVIALGIVLNWIGSLKGSEEGYHYCQVA